MRLLPLAAIALLGCSSDPEATPDPTDVAAAATGVGGSTSVATTSADATSTADATSSADSTAGVGGHGGDGGAPPTSSSTGAGGDGGAPAQGGGFEDGARLRARYNRGADGSRAPRGDFVDTRLGGTVCSWRIAEDGATRCLPVESFPVVSGWFNDAACTVPLVFPSCDAAYVSEWVDVPGCVAGERVYQVGADAAPGSRAYRVTGAGCVDQGGAGGAKLITPMPATTFASATIETD